MLQQYKALLVQAVAYRAVAHRAVAHRAVAHHMEVQVTNGIRKRSE